MLHTLGCPLGIYINFLSLSHWASDSSEWPTSYNQYAIDSQVSRCDCVCERCRNPLSTLSTQSSIVQSHHSWSGDPGSRGCPLLVGALQHPVLQDFLKEEEFLIPLMHAIKTEFIPKDLRQAAKPQLTFEHDLESHLVIFSLFWASIVDSFETSLHKPISIQVWAECTSAYL